MIFALIPPSAHLKPYIKGFMLLQFKAGAQAPALIKPFPGQPQQSLVFYLTGGVSAFKHGTETSTQFPNIAINGPQLSRFDFQLSPDYRMLSVEFQPGALSKVLAMPLTNEFIDERIDGEALLGPSVRHLYEQLINETRHEQLIQLIEHYLWQRIERQKTQLTALDRVCHFIANHPTCYSLDKLANQACLSVSQFDRRFVQRMGITPKLFARTCRFYEAYQLKDQQPTLDWLSVATLNGYTDYQHLVKDFKQFSGSTPNSLLLAQANAPERILGLK
jgi:AraC-like DNA-binding protein